MSYLHPYLVEVSEQQEASHQGRYIYVILQGYPDRFSRLFRFFSRSRFSHASIGLSDSDWTFFSYVIKGFRTELPRKYPTSRKAEIPCELYRVEVSEEAYSMAKAALDDHLKRSHTCRFSYLNLLLCYLRIKRPLKDRYICSQFVCQILEKVEAVQLAKHYSLYLPDDFMKTKGLELCFSGNLSQLVNPKVLSMTGASGRFVGDRMTA